MVDDNFIKSLPLLRIPSSTRQLLSSLLNPPKVILSDGPVKLPRYWRGLADRLGISTEIALSIEESSNKTAKVLEIWLSKDPEATVGQLLQHLECIDRFDVHDDVLEDLRDVSQKGYFSESRQQSTAQTSLSSANTAGDNSITYRDRPGYIHIYDALVLYDDTDKQFVYELLQRMREQGFELCTVADLQPGHTTEYGPVTQLITDRCRRIILVFSPDFVKNAGANFYSEFAQAHCIESKQRKFIPIVYRTCELPVNMTYYHKLFYDAGDRPMYNFWNKLSQSLEAARMFSQHQQYSRMMESLQSSTSVDNSVPQIQIESAPLIIANNYQSAETNQLFLPSSLSVSTSALNVQTCSITEDSRSLSNMSELSDNSVKKKKRSIVKKMLRPFLRKPKSKECIMVSIKN